MSNFQNTEDVPAQLDFEDIFAITQDVSEFLENLEGMDLDPEDLALSPRIEKFQNIDFNMIYDEENMFNFDASAEYPLPILANGSSSADLQIPELSSTSQETVSEQRAIPAPLSFQDYLGFPYRNELLRQFPSPTLPLRIIDESAYPLASPVVRALQQGLAYRQEQDLNQAIDLAVQDEYEASIQVAAATPSVAPKKSFVRPARVPGKQWIKPNSVTLGKNKRSGNIKSFDPSRFYLPLATRPEPWGTPTSYGEIPFQYTAEGELVPSTKLTSAQMTEYIATHPLHSISGTYSTPNSGLILWVQIVPADSAARYPSQQSDKCRFADCPIPGGTIHKGHYRVAFDEQSFKGLSVDPFHNAGYVHLFCLEKAFNFPQICKDYNVRPEVRVLPEGKNKMAITRDHESMGKIVKRYIRDSEGWSEENEYAYEKTLCYALTKEHLELEPKGRQATREQRGGNSIDKHLNNLDVYMIGEKAAKEGEKSGKRGRGTKRRRSDSEGEEFDLEETARRSRR